MISALVKNTIFFLIFSFLSFAAQSQVKKPLTEAEIKTDLYEVLGIKFDLPGYLLSSDPLDPMVLPNQKTIRDAFLKKIKAEHPDSHLDSKVVALSVDAAQLTRAKEILLTPELRDMYFSGFRQHLLSQPSQFHSGSSGPQLDLEQYGIDPGSLVGTITLGEQPLGFITANTAWQRDYHRIPYLRKNPKENQAIQYNDELEEMKKSNQQLPSPSLDPKWKSWSRRQAIGEIEQEMRSFLLKGNPKLNSVDAAAAKSFFNWWFSLPQSRETTNLALINSILDDAKDKQDISAIIMTASVSHKALRTKKWIQSLLKRPGAFFAVAAIAGTDEVINDVALVNSILNLPEAKNHAHYLWEFLIPRPESADHLEWFTPFIDPNSKASHALFLRTIAPHSHWRNRHPHVITTSLQALVKMKYGAIEQLVYPILAPLDSHLHPEWLELFVKAYSNNYLNMRLQHVLAMDHWFNHPYLAKILNNKSLADLENPVYSLRKANWLKVVALPSSFFVSAPQSNPSVSRPPLRLVGGSCRDAVP